MLSKLLRILAGYALAVAAATAAFILEVNVIFGEAVSSKDAPDIAIFIGLFAWAGLIFAFLARYAGWRRALTFALGGIMATIGGIATVVGIGLGRSVLAGNVIPDMQPVAQYAETASQLFALGCVPGAIGGLTYWLIAIPRNRVTA